MKQPFSEDITSVFGVETVETFNTKEFVFGGNSILLTIQSEYRYCARLNYRGSKDYILELLNSDYSYNQSKDQCPCMNLEYCNNSCNIIDDC